MRIVCLLLVAGCVTDPNGETCVYSPGGGPYCPDDDGGSSGPKYIVTSYHSPTAAPFAGHVRVAMTRTVTDEPSRIETALVRAGEVPVHEPVLDGGAPLEGASEPQLAAIAQRTYLVWRDRETDSRRGALLAGDGSLVGPITGLGNRDGWLHVAGERFVFVHAPDADGTMVATWIDQDGRHAGVTELATDVADRFHVLDVGGGDGFIALAIQTQDNEVMISRIADDGALLDRTLVALEGETYDGQIVTTRDGGVLGQFRVVADKASRLELVHLAADGTITVQPSTLPQMQELVRVPMGLVAISYHPFAARLLDETGTTELAAPYEPGGVIRMQPIPTPDGFAVIHGGGSVPIAVTLLPGGVAAPRIEIARSSSEEAGCGCRTASPGTSALFGLALLGVLRRRRMLASCKSRSSAPA